MLKQLALASAALSHLVKSTTMDGLSLSKSVYASTHKLNVCNPVNILENQEGAVVQVLDLEDQRSSALKLPG